MCMIEFKTDRELVNYIGNEKVEMIGTGTEGSVFLTKEDDTIKYIKRRYRILYNSSIITSSLFKLDSFFFPTEIIIDDSRVSGYRAKYFANDIFNSNKEGSINLEKMLIARSKMIDDIKILSSEKYSISDLDYNLMFDGEKFGAIDTLSYFKNKKLRLSDNIYKLDNAIKYNLNRICPMTIFMNHLSIEEMVNRVIDVNENKVINYKKVI